MKYPIKCRECKHCMLIHPTPKKKELKKMVCHHCNTRALRFRKDKRVNILANPEQNKVIDSEVVLDWFEEASHTVLRHENGEITII